MNATSLYVSTSRLVFQADPEDTASWSDLYRLIPYLRQSLSCTVCGNLLIEPYTPTETNCQHHVCRSCKGGKKKLKPSCSWCKNYEKYVENVQLRILLQCYKNLCEYVANSCIYRRLINANVIGNSNLIDLINEGSGFKDEFKGSCEQNPAYSVSGVYTSTSTQTSALTTVVGSLCSDYSLQNKIKVDQVALSQDLQVPIKNNSTESNIDNPAFYSVMYDGSGSKLTLKRTSSENKNDDQVEVGNIPIIEVSEKTVQNALQTQSAKRRSRGVILKKSPQTPSKTSSSTSGSGTSLSKTGCRCGNATATPGKLTCCGQRCPCYIDSKACLDCKCRGCRNPHTSDGHKIRPIITELQPYQLQLDNSSDISPLSNRHFPFGSSEVASVSSATVQVVGMYTTQLHSVSGSSPGIILDGNSVVTTELESSDIKLDV